jgi:peptidoglycan/xylan/chitin deacetylase (PgdA/CDA1 family)
MTGTFNVITGLVGRQGALSYMSWEQIAALAAAGMPIESHTVWHRDLGTLSEQDAWGELVGSRDAIAQHLGEAPQIICYPSGEPFRSGSAAAQARILSLAAKAGYVGGLLDPKVAGAEQSSAAPLELDRIRVAGEETLDQFAVSVQAA